MNSYPVNRFSRCPKLIHHEKKACGAKLTGSTRYVNLTRVSDPKDDWLVINAEALKHGPILVII